MSDAIFVFVLRACGDYTPTAIFRDPIDAVALLPRDAQDEVKRQLIAAKQQRSFCNKQEIASAYSRLHGCRYIVMAYQII